jgi:hypothetical protein
MEAIPRQNIKREMYSVALATTYRRDNREAVAFAYCRRDSTSSGLAFGGVQ